MASSQARFPPPDLGMAGPMTDCERVLAALRQGPRTASELYSLGCVAHSRISDLRRKGHVISCVRVSNDGARGYVYTLVREAGLGATETQEPLPPQPGDEGDSVAPNPDQLVLV